MKLSLICPLVAMAVLAACTSPRDSLEDAALQASRAGTLVAESDRGRTTAALDAGSRLAENFYFIAKYQASAEQKKYVETAAPKAAVKARQPKRTKPVAAKKESGSSSAHSKPAVISSKPARYIAVQTKQDARAKSATSVMVWDTQSEEVVGNNVYDLNARPPDGAVIRFETFSAEFVAAGT